MSFKNGVPDYEDEAISLFSRMDVDPSAIDKFDYNRIIADLKTFEIWDSLDCFWLLASHDSQAAQLNWVEDDHNLTTVNTPTFTAYEGYQGNGTDERLDTDFNPTNDGVHYLQDGAFVAVYVLEGSPDVGSDVGLNGVDDMFIRTKHTNENVIGRLNDQTNSSIAVDTSIGITVLVRESSSVTKIYKNGRLLFTFSSTSTGLPNGNIQILSAHTSSAADFSPHKNAFVAIGGALTEAQIFNFAKIINRYMTEKGANTYSAQHDVILVGDKTSNHKSLLSSFMDAAVLKLYPSYVIGTGDYADTGEGDVSDLMFRYNPYSSNDIIYSAFGNHDDDSTADGSDFKSFFNITSTYYSRRIDEAEFFFYDVGLKEDETGWYSEVEVEARDSISFQTSTQGIWLLNALSNSKAIWKILVIHFPAWTSNTTLNDAPGMRWDWFSYNVDVILNGHTHHYERLIIDTGTGNVDIINLGTLGAGQAGWAIPRITGSQVAYNDTSDADFEAGMYTTLDITETSLSFRLFGVDSSQVVSAIKDSLIIME